MENKIVVTVENVNGVLVTTSNRVAEELGVNHKDLLDKIGGYIRKFSNPQKITKAESSALVKEFYIESTYKVEGNFKRYKNYLITKKGIAQLIGGYNSAVEKAFDLNVAYINRFEEMEKALQQRVDSYMIADPIERAKRWIEEEQKRIEQQKQIKQLEEEKKTLNKTIEHKEDVIVGLVDDIELKDKRQILNQVVRYKNANYKHRWQMLYYEFEKKFHIDLQRRFDNYNLNNKPKYKSKLDYIQYHMDKLPQLYEIACKLFEGDINQIIKDYQELKNS